MTRLAFMGWVPVRHGYIFRQESRQFENVNSTASRQGGFLGTNTHEKAQFFYLFFSWSVLWSRLFYLIRVKNE